MKSTSRPFREFFPAASLFLVLGMFSGRAEAEEISVVRLPDRLRVEVDGNLFTEYLFHFNNRPILYPVIGPHGVEMTRNYPMKTDVPGEQHDHPHHTSIWYSHWPVNGVDFFTVGENTGSTRHREVLETQSGPGLGMARVATEWLAPDGRIILTDERVLKFRVRDSARIIDWEITLMATHGEVTLGDSDHGAMAIRTHPNLRLSNDPEEGVTGANGTAVNSEGIVADSTAGQSGGAVWGKRARWIDYSGDINGRKVGIAILDHPSNPRHPTHWMARGYGYIGACPFGLNSFEGKPPGTGDMTIPAGGRLTFRYRFVFHENGPEEAGIEREWQDFAAAGK